MTINIHKDKVILSEGNGDFEISIDYMLNWLESKIVMIKIEQKINPSPYGNACIKVFSDHYDSISQATINDRMVGSLIRNIKDNTENES